MSVLLIAEHNNKELKSFTLNASTAASQIDNDVHAVLLPTNGKIKMSFSIEEIAMDLGLKERQEF